MAQGEQLDSAGEVTRLLIRWNAGEQDIAAQLMPLVYEELRRMARTHARRERGSHTLQPTALVNEAYLRLTRDSQLNPRCRAHFFGIASTAMRRILVEHARAKASAKRGSGARAVPLDDVVLEAPRGPGGYLELDAALDELAALDARKGQLIQLKYFAGYTIEEMAEIFGISTATVERDLRAAHAWLRKRLNESAPRE